MDTVKSLSEPDLHLNSFVSIYRCASLYFYKLTISPVQKFGAMDLDSESTSIENERETVHNGYA